MNSYGRKYLVLDPDGTFHWIDVCRESMCDSFRNAIGCDWLEKVTLPYGFNIVVDECGKIKQNPQPLNLLASRFYPGSLYGDPIVGPVVFVRIGLVNGESDWCPLTERDLNLISLITGEELPEK